MHPVGEDLEQVAGQEPVTLGVWQHLGGLGDRGALAELAKEIVEARRAMVYKA